MILKLKWWKWICVLLFIYVFTRGLLTPLKPGIEEISPLRARSGEALDLNIKAYNTHFKQGFNTVYIKDGTGKHIQTSDIDVSSDVELIAHFKLPEFLPTSIRLAQYSVIVNSDYSGTCIIPSKLILEQDSINEDAAKSLWTDSKPEFAHKNKYWFPYRNILYETIRNTFFHVSLWFAMFSLLGASVYNSIRYLRTNQILYDVTTNAQVRVAYLFGILGLMTGSLWARYTWGAWWTNDIKLNMAALSMLIYSAFLIIRAGIDDPDRRARVSSAFNVFALVAVIPLIFVLPRLTDSLHPGNGGNPAFGSEDMDNALRLVFYPAVIAFILLGFWMAELRGKADLIDLKSQNSDNI